MIINRQNIWKIVWVIGVYATLVLVLYLVVLYKVKWEDLDLNKYLYFYKCSNELCTTSEKGNIKYINSIKCDNNICPIITEINDNYVILNREGKSYIYDYTDNKIINNAYSDYHFIANNFIIATNNENLQGVIDYSGSILINFSYNDIKSYNNGYITYKEGNKMGIASQDNSVNIKPKYDDISLIDKYKFAYKNNDGYYIAKYDSEVPISNTIYDYVYSDSLAIFTVKDNKIDILDSELRSKLLMKIDTYYSYTTEKEIKSLDIYTKNNLMYFKVYTGDNTYKKYMYDIANSKLYNN